MVVHSQQSSYNYIPVPSISSPTPPSPKNKNKNKNENKTNSNSNSINTLHRRSNRIPSPVIPAPVPALGLASASHSAVSTPASSTTALLPIHSDSADLRNVTYLTGPSTFDGLITPIHKNHPLSNWDHRISTSMALSADDLLHTPSPADNHVSDPPSRPSLSDNARPKSAAELNAILYGPDPLGLDPPPPDPLPSSAPVHNLVPSHYGSTGPVTFLSTPRGGPLPEHTLRRHFRLFWLQFFAALFSNLVLILIVFYALLRRLASKSLDALRRKPQKPAPKEEKRPWDDVERWKKERVTKDYNYYADSCGYKIVEQTVETLDGYYLQVWKVVVPHKPDQGAQEGKGGYPVLIQHGLFQSAGSFITSEERSLAFWLAEHGGYQVYLGNNRGLFNMGHRKLKRSDPRFWDYNIKELALYDLPALVDHVLQDTGHSRLAFIGHSQGNATMFCSLAQGMVPGLGRKLSCFIALAPAVYAGPLTEGFPFGALKGMRWRTWRRVFGIMDFLPIMRHCVDWLPSSLFGFFGYQMFAFLFSWTDRNWLLRRKLKMFRFTPSPVSSAGIFWWTGYGGFSTRGCVLDPEVEKWWDERFPPLSIYHGSKDYLVLADPLLKRLQTHEKTVRLIRNFELEGGEHCDTFWHADAVELCFHLIKEDIDSTRDSENSRSEDAQEAERATDPVQRILCEPSQNLVEDREGMLNDLLDGRVVAPLDASGLVVEQDRDPGQAPVMELNREV